MEATKWGIIGPGSIARDFARDLQLVTRPQTVHAVLGKSQESIKNFAAEFNVPKTFDDLDDFVTHAEVDCVYVATPHTLHYEEVLACLNRKIPVLCEKPMTINKDQSDDLVRASRANNTFLMEGMWIRFLPSITDTLNIVQNGTLGRVRSIKASMGFKAEYDANSRFFDPELGGGSLLDLGIYPVFLSMLLLGKPNVIKAIGSLSPEGVDENCIMLFQYKNGQRALLDSSLVAESNSPAEIYCEKGVIRILHPWYEKASGIEIDTYGEGKIIYPCQWEGRGLQFEVEEMLSCINNKKISSDLMTHGFSRDMMSVMDEVRNQIDVTYDMYE